MGNDTEEKDEKESKLTPVGEGAEEATETLEEQIEKDNKAEEKEPKGEEVDERVGHAEEDEDEEGPEGETSDQKRERRRRERKNRRDRDARLRREVNFLRSRNEQLERRFSEVSARQDQHENLSIDQRIGGIDAQIRQAEQIHAKAVESSDGETATEALRIKDELLQNRQRLLSAKEQRQTRESPGTKERAAGPDPEVMRQMNSWMKRNDWFDRQLGDETSHLVKVMEDRLASEGDLDPRDPEYWEELDRRVQKRFPELKGRRVRDDDDDVDESEEEERPHRNSSPQKKKPNGGPRFSVRGRERPLGPNEVYVDAERRRAMEEAGVWDDPETRERFLKSYQRYDAEARTRRRSE